MQTTVRITLANETLVHISAAVVSLARFGQTALLLTSFPDIQRYEWLY